MNAFKPSEITVYDNLYSKPSQIGPLTSNGGCSMAVLFDVGGVLYYGNYDYSSGTWNTLPSDKKSRAFKDQVVEYWFYPPWALGLFKRYADDVRTKRCVDSISRLDEFVGVESRCGEVFKRS